MRLLNTTTLKFKETYTPGTQDMKYAILSHRWGDDEVSYEDFVLAQQVDEYPDWWPPSEHGRRVKKRAGYKKIKKFCSVAQELDYAWCWVDTCCIDKRSSAELSEAIDSMWKWYGNAAICLVYMSDVTTVPNPLAPEDDGAWSRFRASSWFTRCWTLQELLAPRRLIFMTAQWVKIGRISKSRTSEVSVLSKTLAREVAQATRIPEPILKRDTTIMTASIAQKMSWAAGRQATREEDVAYSLLGLFDINMPLLYGEGQKAFNRLQHEILRQSSDLTIFAWGDVYPLLFRSLLAVRPWCFSFSGNVEKSTDTGVSLRSSITNLGLEVTLDCEPVSYYPARTEPDTQTTALLINAGRIKGVDGKYSDYAIALKPEQVWVDRPTASGAPILINGRTFEWQSGGKFAGECSPNPRKEPYRLILPIT
ncbi:hypothetical protein LTR85_001467 [Meristemomyces frigidus]|nr:hypothetical protein LTR85_001467 [Meristemomyces frigidus]